jgi:DNA polymerase-3 subunit gamma/tau
MAKRKTATEVAQKPAEAAPPTGKEYTVLARRYRPQQFGELVGQEAVAQALANALQSGRVAHAYLFTGARGVGKTSTARILAKALNCANGPTTTPCGECEMCRAIAAGEDVDVLEIDGASNRGIDEVREIRQNVQFRPARSRYKIYIIDEVHMLTTPAFNALLKTLEEPPPHVKFIFATTEAHKIPVTILSRCQRFDFGNISLTRIVERLRQIVAGEGLEADDEALLLVARRAGGSMRDAQSLLDQLLAFGGDRLTTDAVHQLLGTAGEERVAALASAVLQKDPRQALELLGSLVEQGQQLGELLDQLIEYWRDLMVVRCAGTDGQELSVSGEHLAALKQHAEALKLDSILAGLDILVAAKSRLRATSQTRVILEMALVRLAQLEDLVPLSQLVQWLNQEGASAARPGANASAAGTNARPFGTSAVAAGLEKKKLAGDDSPAPAAEPIPFIEANLSDLWQQVLAEAGFALASDLRKVASVAISGPNTLVLRVPKRYNAHGVSAFDPSRLGRVEAVLSRVVGQPCSARVEVVEDDPSEPGQAGVTARPGAAPGSTRQLREKVKQLPLVQKAREVLEAEIIHVEPDFGETTAPAERPDHEGEPPAEED